LLYYNLPISWYNKNSNEVSENAGNKAGKDYSQARSAESKPDQCLGIRLIPRKFQRRLR